MKIEREVCEGYTIIIVLIFFGNEKFEHQYLADSHHSTPTICCSVPCLIQISWSLKQILSMCVFQEPFSFSSAPINV